MVRLSEIPPTTLKKIEQFVKEMKGKVPVVSKGENLVDLVEKKFGYRLSPSQIYDLQRGYKTLRIKVDVDALRELEKEFGSISKGIKEVLKLYKQTNIPPHLKKYHEVLKRKEEWTLEEIMEELLPLCDYDEQKVYKIIGELGSYNVVHRVGKKFVVYRVPVNPLLKYLFG